MITTEATRKKLVSFIRTEIRRNGFTRALLGLSGGVDSSLAARLAQEALGKSNVLGIFMPYEKKDDDARDIRALVRQLGIRFKTIDIAPMVDAYFKRIPKADRIRRGNMMSRQRMAVLYDQSKEFRGLVLGCGNRTEILLGYFTLFGDGGCALNPLATLYKTQVWQLAEALKLPRSIILRKPSAGLWAGQTDEDELGFAYWDVDRLLSLMVDKSYSTAQLLGQGFSKEFIETVKNRIASTEFKRRPPSTPQ